MALIYPNIVRALFRLGTVGAPPAPGADLPLMSAAGVAANALYNGAGDYDVTLDQGLAEDAAVFVANQFQAAPANHAYSALHVYSSDTVWNIQYLDADVAGGTVAASDAPFFAWAVFAFPGA